MGPLSMDRVGAACLVAWMCAGLAACGGTPPPSAVVDHPHAEDDHRAVSAHSRPPACPARPDCRGQVAARRGHGGSGRDIALPGGMRRALLAPVNRLARELSAAERLVASQEPYPSGHEWQRDLSRSRSPARRLMSVAAGLTAQFRLCSSVPLDATAFCTRLAGAKEMNRWRDALIDAQTRLHQWTIEALQWQMGQTTTQKLAEIAAQVRADLGFARAAVKAAL